MGRVIHAVVCVEYKSVAEPRKNFCLDNKICLSDDESQIVVVCKGSDVEMRRETRW